MTLQAFPIQCSTRNGLLAALSPDDFELLSRHLVRGSLESGAVLNEPGTPIASVVFPEDGIVSVSNQAAGQVEVGLVGREGLVGAPVVLDADRAPFWVRVEFGGGCLAIPAPALIEALDRSRSLRTTLTRYVHAFTLQAASTAYANARFTVEQRLARLLLMIQDRLPEEQLHVTHEWLARTLAVRRPGVTVATHILEGLGAIRATRGRIDIRSRDLLVTIAGDSYGKVEAEYDRVVGIGNRPADVREAA